MRGEKLQNHSNIPYANILCGHWLTLFLINFASLAGTESFVFKLFFVLS